MPRFHYEVRQPSGQVERGTAEGDTAQAVARALQAKGYFVVQVRPEAAPRARRERRRLREKLAQVFYPVSAKSLAMFFASLRALLSSGMNVSQAMSTLSERTANPVLARAAREMAEEAARGRPMSSVLGRHPSAFDATLIALVEAGEESGLLEQTAARAAAYCDRAFQLQQTYRWQTFYPKVLLLALLIIPTIPQLVLGSLQGWLHTVLLRTVPLLGVIAALWYGWRALRSVPACARVIDGIKLLVPWFGSLARRIATARWARALAMLLGAGVPVHRAMVAAAAAAGNASMQEALVRQANRLHEGHSLTDVVAASGAVPAMAVDLLVAAEQSGSYESALEKVAEYYESETEVGGKQTAVAVGVGLYLLIALAIGFVVISFWMGYFSSLRQFLE